MAVPTRGEVARWDFARLRDVGAAHEHSGQRLRQVVDGLRTAMYAIDDAEWGGDARLAAHRRVDREEVEVKRLASSIESVGVALSNAAGEIEFAAGRMTSIAEWAENEPTPFVVSDGWAISDPSVNPSADRVEQLRNWQADLTSLGSGLELTLLTHARTIEVCRAGVEVNGPPAAGFGLDGRGLLSGNDIGREDLQKFSLAFEAAFGRPPSTPEEWQQASGLLAELPRPGSGYGSYHDDFSFVVGENWTQAQMVHHVAENFNQYFPFRSDEAEVGGIAVGDEIGLNSPAGDQPVRVEQITNEGFVLTSLPGHAEGADRTIVFSIESGTGEVGPGYRRWNLHVEAGGPTNVVSGFPGNGIAAREIWRGFAGNLTSRLPEDPDNQ